MRVQHVDDIMERLANQGVAVILKVDHERASEGGEPWTVVLSGPGIGGQSFIRAESESLDDCLSQVFGRLRETGSQWDWLTASGDV